MTHSTRPTFLKHSGTTGFLTYSPIPHPINDFSTPELSPWRSTSTPLPCSGVIARDELATRVSLSVRPIQICPFASASGMITVLKNIYHTLRLPPLLNPLLPRPKGGKDPEGMKKQIPSSDPSSGRRRRGA